MKEVNVKETAKLLLDADNLLILCHIKPDGDTLGSGMALLWALHRLGKHARIFCADGFPERFSFLWPGLDLEQQEAFEPEFVVAVDVAEAVLIGKPWRDQAERIDLCIDHHPSNRGYAKHMLLDAKAAATAQIMGKVLREMTTLTQEIARCIYTGLATDTGCFRYSNTSGETLRMAADMVDMNVGSDEINQYLFETKTAARMELEKRVLQTLEYHHDGQIVFMTLPRAAIEELQVPEADLEGLSSLTRQIEGVEIGVTLKEMTSGNYRVSVRSSKRCNASELCAKLDGGGHARAAGCFLRMPLEEAKNVMLQACLEALEPKK